MLKALFRTHARENTPFFNAFHYTPCFALVDIFCTSPLSYSVWGSVMYCSKDCQGAHWKEHKGGLCKHFSRSTIRVAELRSVSGNYQGALADCKKLLKKQLISLGPDHIDLVVTLNT